MASGASASAASTAANSIGVVGQPVVFISDALAYPLSHVASRFSTAGFSVVRAPVNSPASVRLALGCDVVVLSLTSAAGATEALSVCAALESLLVTGASVRPRGVAVLSSLLAWDTPRSGAAAARAICEGSTAVRSRPTPARADARAMADAESRLLALPSTPNGGAPAVHVLGAGLIYGAGEGPLRSTWMAAREDAASSAPRACVDGGAPRERGAQQPLSVVAPAGAPRAVPTVHAEDVTRVLIALVSELARAPWPTPPGYAAPLPPSPYGRLPPYIVLVDASADSGAALVAAISSAAGDGRWRYATAQEMLLDDAVRDADGHATAARGTRAAGGARGGALDALLLSTNVPPIDESVLARGAVRSFLLPPANWHSNAGLVDAAARGIISREFAKAGGCAPPFRVALAGASQAVAPLAASLAAANPRALRVSPARALAAILADTADGALCDGTASGLDALAALRVEVTATMNAAANAAAAAQLAEAEAAAAATAAAAAAAALAAKGKGGKAPPAAVAAEKPLTPPAAPLPSSAPTRLPPALMARVIRTVLSCPAARAFGWILEGAPRTAAEAIAVFGDAAASSPAAAAAASDAAEDAAVLHAAMSQGLCFAPGAFNASVLFSKADIDAAAAATDGPEDSFVPLSDDVAPTLFVVLTDGAVAATEASAFSDVHDAESVSREARTARRTARAALHHGTAFARTPGSAADAAARTPARVLASAGGVVFSSGGELPLGLCERASGRAGAPAVAYFTSAADAAPHEADAVLHALVHASLIPATNVAFADEVIYSGASTMGGGESIHEHDSIHDHASVEMPLPAKSTPATIDVAFELACAESRLLQARTLNRRRALFSTLGLVPGALADAAREHWEATGGTGGGRTSALERADGATAGTITGRFVAALEK